MKKCFNDVTLTDRQLATVLVSLRHFQNLNEDQRKIAFPEHFDKHDPLNDQEINDLCIHLNVASCGIIKPEKSWPRR